MFGNEGADAGGVPPQHVCGIAGLRSHLQAGARREVAHGQARILQFPLQGAVRRVPGDEHGVRTAGTPLTGGVLERLLHLQGDVDG